jgi:hypothetical protein
MGNVRRRLYREWLQIRGNAKWQAVWSFIEPYWKLAVGAVLSMIASTVTYFWEWVTGLHFLFLFLFFFSVYVLCWGLVAFFVFIFRDGKQQPAEELLPLASLPPPKLSPPQDLTQNKHEPQFENEHIKQEPPISPISSPYLRLTNIQLQKEALAVLREFNRFLATATKKDNASVIPYLPITTDGSPEEWRKAQAKHIKAYHKFSSWLQSQYNAQFKVDMILLRNELSSRVTDPEQGIDSVHISLLYEHPTNLLDMRELASHLERLAKQLT